MATEKINIVASYLNGFAYESLDVADSVVNLTESKYKNSEGQYAKRAIIIIETAQIRYRYDSGDPTATEGMIRNPMDILILNTSANIRNFRAIRKGTTSAKIFITYEI